MLACFAWTNSQIINITNTVVNLYPEEHADLYIRIGRHMSSELIAAIKESKVYDNVFFIDPFQIDHKKLPFGKVAHFRMLFLKEGYKRAYGALLDRLCKGKVYQRVLLAWFYTENVFLVDYWAKSNPDLHITLVDEGTGSYCYYKKNFILPLSLISSKKERLKRLVAEGSLSRKYSKRIDSFALYRPEYTRPDVDFPKLTIPVIQKDSNPVLYKILCNSVSNLETSHFIRYNKRDVIFFSQYSPEGLPFDQKSLLTLETIVQTNPADKIIAKIHMGNTAHAENFAKSYEKRIFVDRNIFLFEGLYMQLEHPSDKVLVSCISTAAINPKFMFGVEPYVIFTFRLYNTYRQLGVERDDWMAAALIDAYSDKSRVMIPNSLSELEEMLLRVKAERLHAPGKCLPRKSALTEANLSDLPQSMDTVSHPANELGSPIAP